MLRSTSRADRLGFIVFVVLASLLAVLLINDGGSKTSEAADVQTLGAPVPAVAEAPVVPTTAPIPVPVPAEEPAVLPLAAPADDAMADEGAADEATADDAMADEAMADDSSADEGDDEATADEGADDEATAGDSSAADNAARTAPAADSEDAGDTGDDGGAATADDTTPNPQPQATEVPNPQPQATATAVPNPQPQATTTAVPNPQPKATEVPNPQAPAAPVGDLPAPAARGGTFTHTLVATVSQPTLYTSPGGAPFIPTFRGTALPPVNPTVFGNPLVYPVLAGSPDDSSGWAQVRVPAYPNNTTAWVQTSQFQWSSSNRMIQINVSQNTVTVFEGGNVLLTTGAVTGKSSSRTPIASGWVEEVIDGGRLGAAYGPVALSLGLFSEQLTSFGGSVPKIALHGTNNPGLIGQYASNGCIRVRNEIIQQIRGMVTPGSKVEIVT